MGVRPYGSFVAFDVEAASGTVLEVYGMVHLSEIAWDFCKDARLAVKVRPRRHLLSLVEALQGLQSLSCCQNPSS